MFVNEGCVVPLLAEDVLNTSGVDQSDCGTVSHDPPPGPVEGEGSLALVTADTLYSSYLCHILCTSPSPSPLLGHLWHCLRSTALPMPSGHSSATGWLLWRQICL